MLTISAIKADVGSIGGHTRPSRGMMEAAQQKLQQATADRMLTGFDVTHTGDDICPLMVHQLGTGNAQIHDFAWSVFLAATDIARSEGLYGTGQDLLKDAPSGNVRGAGPRAAMLPMQELEYSAFRKSLASLDEQFVVERQALGTPGQKQKSDGR